MLSCHRDTARGPEPGYCTVGTKADTNLIISSRSFSSISDGPRSLPRWVTCFPMSRPLLNMIIKAKNLHKTAYFSTLYDCMPRPSKKLPIVHSGHTARTALHCSGPDHCTLQFLCNLRGEKFILRIEQSSAECVC